MEMRLEGKREYERGERGDEDRERQKERVRDRERQRVKEM
jgi:hypothetical protein